MSPNESNGDATGEDLVVRIEDSVAWVVINSPDTRNSLTADMRDGIAEHMRGFSSDLRVRAVVITAAGDQAFCTGANLRGGRRAPAPRPDDAPDVTLGDGARTIREGWQALVASILDCEKPVIAAVNGTAAGGGMHLALACDLVVAAEESKFIEVFIRRGIVPDAGGAWLLTRLIGIQKTKELFFFGDDVPAAKALELGLVNQVVPRAELESTVRALAQRLAEGPTKAIGMAKFLVNRALDVDRGTAFYDESIVQELITHTEDSKEGIASFVERRPSAFKGW